MADGRFSLTRIARAVFGAPVDLNTRSGANYSNIGWGIVSGQTPSQYEQNGRAVRINGFERNAVVNAVTRIVSDIPGSVPLQGYRIATDGDKTPVDRRDPMQILLDRPRVGMSAQRMRQLTTAHLVMYGNAFWSIERNTPKGPPVALRLIHPEYMRWVYRDRETLLPIVYEWTDELGGLHANVWTDIVHFRDLTLDDTLFGFPRMASALLDIVTDGEASQYVRQIITNNGTPGMVVMLDSVVSQEQAANAEARYHEKMAVRGGRGRTVFWPGVQKVEKIGFDLTQLEFPALRAIAREDICAAAGVDPRMVGVASAKGKDGGLSGEQFKEARQRLYLQTCSPLMGIIESECDLSLAPEFGDLFIRFDPEMISEITEDMTQTSARVVSEVIAGVRSIEEARGAVGLPADMTPTDYVLLPTTGTLRVVSKAQEDAAAETPDPIETATALAAAKQPALGAGDTVDAAKDTAPRTVRAADVATAVAPSFAVGDRVVATVNHMAGMKGMSGVVHAANAGSPPYYSVDFDTPMGEGNPHKWLNEREIKAESSSKGGMGKMADSAGSGARLLTRTTLLTDAQKIVLQQAFDLRASSHEATYHAAAVGLFAVERHDFSAAVRSAMHGRSDPSDDGDEPIDEHTLGRLLSWVIANYGARGSVISAWRARFRGIIRSTVDEAGRELSSSIATATGGTHAGTAVSDAGGTGTTSAPAAGGTAGGSAAGTSDTAAVPAKVNVSWNLKNPRVEAAIEGRAERLAEHVTATTGEQVTALLKTSREQGLGINATAKLIDDTVFGSTALDRAKLIARTETVGAFNQGELEAARASGVVNYKSWLSKRDPRVRDSHEEADAQGRIALDDAFNNGLDYPGDPSGGPEAVCNCRCTMLYHITEDTV